MDDHSTFFDVTQDRLKTALLSNRYFKKSPPVWKNLPTPIDARNERRRRAKLFRKHEMHKQARILEACKRHQRCLSGACPVCIRATQRYFVHRLERQLRPNTDFSLVSIIPGSQLIRGQLNILSMQEFRSELQSKMVASKIHFFIGGIDFSLNEHREGQFETHWSPHVWGMINNFRLPEREALFRSQYPKHRNVEFVSWDGDNRALGYMLKHKFDRRISYTAKHADGSRRSFQDTTDDKLRSAERAELYSYLDQIGIGSRMLLMGVDTSKWPYLEISL